MLDPKTYIVYLRTIVHVLNPYTLKGCAEQIRYFLHPKYVDFVVCLARKNVFLGAMMSARIVLRWAFI